MVIVVKIFKVGDIYILEVKEKVVYYKSKFYFIGGTLDDKLKRIKGTQPLSLNCTTFKAGVNLYNNGGIE